MLIINNLQKLDPSHVTAQPVTRVDKQAPILIANATFMAPSALCITMQQEFNAKTQIRTNYRKTLRVGRRDAKEENENGFSTNTRLLVAFASLR
jgi:hypothetical protein